MKKTKRFDCVAMKHQAQERILQELAGLSRTEELEYWQRIVDQDRLRREGKQAASQRAAGARESR
jgi:hypothetical protein